MKDQRTSGASGGSIFRCTTKDRGERRAKGVATPFNPPELMRDRKPDVLWLYVFAMVQLTRLSRLRCREANTLGVRSAYSLASACCALTVVRQHRRKKYPWGAVRLNSLHFRNNPTAKFAIRRLFFECQQFHCTWCSRQESGGSSACGNEIVAKRRCLAFRRSRAKRTPPARRRTSLNRVNCTNANS